MFYKDCHVVTGTILKWRRSLEERTDKERGPRGYRNKREEKRNKKQTWKKKERKKERKDGQDKPSKNLSDEKWRSRARVKPLLDEQETTEDGKELNKAIVDGKKKTSSGEKCGMKKVYFAKTEATWFNLLQSPDAF